LKYKKLCCNNCNSIRIKKRGLRKTQNRGKIQRYFCHNCKRSFVIDDGFFRMRNHQNKITLYIDLFYRGVSTRKIQEHLKAFYPHNSTNVSVYNWIIKYSNMISSFTDKLKLNSSPNAMIDEMEYKRRKDNHKSGTVVNWFIDAIDTETRFMIASTFAPNRGNEAIKEVVKGMRFKKQKARLKELQQTVLMFMMKL